MLQDAGKCAELRLLKTKLLRVGDEIKLLGSHVILVTFMPWPMMAFILRTEFPFLLSYFNVENRD